jgi:hypothetical protein
MPESDAENRPPTRTQTDRYRDGRAVRAADPSDEPRWVVEELDGAPAPIGPRTRADWRLHLAVVLTFAVVGVGVVGRLVAVDGAPDGDRPAAASPSVRGQPAQDAADDPPARGAAGPTVSFEEPAANGRLFGGTVPVTIRVTPPRTPVELAAVVGGAVIGQGAAGDDATGRIPTELRVFAPPVQVEAELLALPADTTPATATVLRAQALARLTITLAPEGPIGWWPADTERTPGRLTVRVSGCAPLDLGSVSVRLVSATGDVLDRATVPIVRNDAIPGAIGGHALGLGSFEGTLTTDADVRVLRVEADWRDAAGASWGTSVLPIEVGGPAAAHDRS